MANLRNKLRLLTETEQTQEQPGDEHGRSTSAVERVAAYSAKENEPVRFDDNPGAPAEPAGEEPNPEAEVPADLAVVGEEVGTVLKSAQEAAARIRRTSHEEAERLRTSGSQIRAEAEAYAKDARAAADEFAEERRREAERAAAQIVSDAQKLLAAADAEVAQKMREADAKARERLQALQVETERYEKRLESILAVFRGMTSQLEDLVGRQQTASGNAVEMSDDALDDALRPDRSSSRVG